MAVFEVESWLVAEGKDHEHEVENAPLVVLGKGTSGSVP